MEISPLLVVYSSKPRSYYIYQHVCNDLQRRIVIQVKIYLYTQSYRPIPSIRLRRFAYEFIYNENLPLPLNESLKSTVQGRLIKSLIWLLISHNVRRFVYARRPPLTFSLPFFFPLPPPPPHPPPFFSSMARVFLNPALSIVMVSFDLGISSHVNQPDQTI